MHENTTMYGVMERKQFLAIRKAEHELYMQAMFHSTQIIATKAWTDRTDGKRSGREECRSVVKLDDGRIVVLTKYKTAGYPGIQGDLCELFDTEQEALEYALSLYDDPVYASNKHQPTPTQEKKACPPAPASISQVLPVKSPGVLTALWVSAVLMTSAACNLVGPLISLGAPLG